MRANPDHADADRATSVPAAVDAVIVGAGAAGLSLACHLAASWHGRSVLVVDDGAVPVEARAWAYWSRGEHLLDPAAGIGVDHVLVRAPGLTRRLALGRYRYRTMSGPGLIRAVSTQVASASASGVELVRGVVTSVTDEGAGARVGLILAGSPGSPRTVRARWVFDSVGIGHRTSDVTAGPHLSFLGHRVECDTDVFDPATPTLMDSRTDQAGGLSFVYVLPQTPRCALVEHTTFVVPGPPAAVPAPAPTPTVHAVAVDEYLSAVVGAGSWSVVGTEKGVIPLRTSRPAGPRGAVVPIGARAGMVRASTGYGFERMQRHARAITDSLTRWGHPYDVAAPSAWFALLDRWLLAVVRDEPEVARRVFARLFVANPPERVLAFLDEDLGVVGQLTLCTSLPVAPFVRAAVRHLTRPRTRRRRAPVPTLARPLRQDGSDPGTTHP